MFPGFQSRLERDIRNLHLKNVLGGDASREGKVKIAVENPPDRKHAVFAGGAVLADIMRDNNSFWLSKSEWDELGPQRALASKFARH